MSTACRSETCTFCRHYYSQPTLRAFGINRHDFTLALNCFIGCLFKLMMLVSTSLLKIESKLFIFAFGAELEDSIRCIEHV